jgi:hypothetical protein
MATTVANEDVREQIETMLANGLVTEAFPRADTHDEVMAITRRLREEGQSLTAKLVIGGFTLTPVEHGGMEQLCRTCMYYHMRRKHCVLPELDVPVEPEWSCRLWRI